MTRTRSLRYGGQCSHQIISDAPALEFDSVCHRYSGNKEPSVENISFSVRRGKKVALMGPNGAGKSTLLNLVLGIEPLKKGEIRVHGLAAADCLHRVAIVPQRNNIDWNFPVSVRQVVMMGCYVHLGWLKSPGLQDHQAVDEALNMLGIKHLSNKLVRELSGGQQQRVMLARTLAQNADILLLDEPLNHVDRDTQSRIFDILEQLTANGKTVIVSTHDVGTLDKQFNRVIFINRQIKADGTPQEVARNIYGISD